MVDLFGADKGNISLPPRLQSPEVLDGQTDDLKHVMIINMQKAFYQVKITDIAKRIQRLQSRNTELEDACIAEKHLRSQTDVETTDAIAQLNRQISGELEKINDFKKRIQTVQKWMEEEKQTHIDKVKAAEERYNKTRLEITSEIKVLNAKINTLEEYKVAKTDLRNKLIAGNNLIAQRDEEAKQRCEQIKRKFKIGREKLKKEMYARLQGLAGSFQTEAAASVAKPMHRLIRENIFLKNELIDIVRESVPKKETIKRNKEADVRTVFETAASKKNTVNHLITSKIQVYLLSAVKEQHTRLKDCVETLKDSESNEIKSAEDIYASTKIQADEALQRISILETGLHKQNTRLRFMNFLRDKSKTELQRCTDIFYDAKYAIACALQMTDTGKDIFEMENKELMPHLLEIFRKGKTERWKNKTPSLSTIPPSEEVYKLGDLGFEPAHIELFPLRRTTLQQKSSKLSTLKILGALGVKLSGFNVTKSQIESEMDIGELDNRIVDLTTVEEADEISMDLSLSLESQEEELGTTITRPKAVEEEEQETDEEEENEKETKVDVEIKLEEGEIANQDDHDDNSETIIAENEEVGSEMLVGKSSEPSL